MTLRWKIPLITGATIFSLLAGAGYWYVFVAGAPQFDAPVVNTKATDLTFKIENFNSKAMGSVRQYGLILPPDYDKYRDRRYRVIFLLHGGHDDERAWYDKYAIATVLHQLYKDGRLPPSIIITPDGNDNRGSSPLFDPAYFDGPNGNVGTLIGSELVEVVKSRYRALNEPEFWAMGGLSSGGWGAFNIGLRHLDHFSVLFSHLGYFTDDSGAANSPQSFVTQLPKEQLQRLRAYMDAGEADPDFIASTQQFHQTLNKLGVKNVFYTFRGGHGISGADYGWNYIHKHAFDSLTFVGEQFKSARR
ncbi:MAG: alpha/beta hydrolase [Xenococcaceae cyanobacterium]